MKKPIALILAVVTVLMPISASAMATASTTTATNNSAELARLKPKADAEIGRRITTLNGLVAIVNAAPHISAADKTNLAGQINPEVIALPALKTKIDADTDLATLKADVQSIYTEFRVYALLVPKVHLVRVADRLSDASAKLTTYADTLQSHIDKAKTAGKNITAVTSTMTDMRNQIASANTDFTAAVNDLISITPTQYNANKSVVTTDRDTLNGGREAAGKALADGKQIRNDLKSLGQD